jgi:uncharacterized membrane protein YiaA
MMTGLLHLHNLLRWVILVLLIWTIINNFLNKNGKETRILTIVSHTMLLLGIIQWFVGDWGLKLIQKMGMGAVMKDAQQRLMAIEHPLTMIIAIALITIGGISVKKGKSNAKWFYIIALVLILSRIPWARALFPGM